MDRRDVEFDVAGSLCRAWLYHPPGMQAKPLPCIVMAHGLGGTREAGLAPYAERLATAGFAVLVFDYRHFGASEGQPRQLVSVRRQLQDWAAALSFARSLALVDSGRIGLWGSSFSGGHVLATAARDHGVAAISAQGPMMDGLAATLNIVSYAGIGRVLHLAWTGLRDQAAALFGTAPVLVPLVAPPGQLAVMSTADADRGYRAIVPPSWRNEICGRLALWLAFYRPVAGARKVGCPALIQVCLHDSVAPPRAAIKAAARIGTKAELKQYPIGHFDIYVGDGFERSCGDQVSFFTRHLRMQQNQ